MVEGRAKRHAWESLDHVERRELAFADNTEKRARSYGTR
jgi:hypothetical protein